MKTIKKGVGYGRKVNTDCMGEADQGGFIGRRDSRVVASAIDKVVEVFVFEEGSCDGASTIIHVVHVVIEGW
jgi:hypothetical protein